MTATRKVCELEILLRPTVGRRGTLLLCIAIPITIFVWMLSVLIGSPPKSEKSAIILVDMIFFVLSVYSAFSGIRGLLNGKLQIDSSGLLIEQHGRSKFIAYENVSNIALTKILAGKSWVQVVAIAMNNFRNIYIYDYYEETAEDIFQFLKYELERKGLGIRFYVKPALSI